MSPQHQQRGPSALAPTTADAFAGAALPTMSPQQQQRGPSALVTGAADGIGRAAALVLASRGGRLSVIDLPAAETAGRATVAACQRAGGDAVWIPCDVSDPVALAAAFAAHEARWGGLDVAVLNAGIGEVRMRRPSLIKYIHQ